MSYRDKKGKHCSLKYKNVYDLNTLSTIQADKCGRKISLESVPRNCIRKLNDVVEYSKLEYISLRDCFKDPTQLLAVLQSMQKNANLYKVHLDIQLNTHNNACIVVLIDLISRGVVISIEVPHQLNGDNTERLLDGILNSRREIKLLNLNGSTLTERALELLQDLLQHGMITKALNMCNCQGVCGCRLTTRDKEMISKAEKAGRRVLKSNIKIEWFPFVKYIGDVDINRSNHKRFEFKRELRKMFNCETRRREEVWTTLIKTGLDAWQEYKPGNKRKEETRNRTYDRKKLKMNEQDLEDVTQRFESQKVSGKPSKSSKKFKFFGKSKKSASSFTNPFMRNSNLQPSFTPSDRTWEVEETSEIEDYEADDTVLGANFSKCTQENLRRPINTVSELPTTSRIIQADVHKICEKFDQRSEQSQTSRECKAVPIPGRTGGSQARTRSNSAGFRFADGQELQQERRGSRQGRRCISESTQCQNEERFVNPPHRDQPDVQNMDQTAVPLVNQNRHNNNNSTATDLHSLMQTILPDGVFRGVTVPGQGTNAPILVINPDFRRIVHAATVCMDTSKIEMPHSRQNISFNGKAAEEEMEEANVQGDGDQFNQQPHGQPEENIRPPEDDGQYDVEELFVDALEEQD